MEDFIYLSFEDVLGYYRETIEQSGGGMSSEMPFSDKAFRSCCQVMQSFKAAVMVS